MKWILKYMVIGLLIYQSHNANAFDPCKDTINHKPRADVEYSPSPGVLEKTKFPITVDLAKRYNLDIPVGLELDAQFGDIEIDANGDIFYNGEDITSDIKDICDNEPSQFETIIEQEASNGDNTNTGRKFP